MNFLDVISFCHRYVSWRLFFSAVKHGKMFHSRALVYLGVFTRFYRLNCLCRTGVCRRCCLVLGKWLIFPVYDGFDFPWTPMVRVNDLLDVALECLVSL